MNPKYDLVRVFLEMVLRLLNSNGDFDLFKNFMRAIKGRVLSKTPMYLDDISMLFFYDQKRHFASFVRP